MAQLWMPDTPEQPNLASICSPDYHQTMLDIATLVKIAQYMDIANVPGPNLLHISITRADGSVQQIKTLGLRAQISAAFAAGLTNVTFSKPRGVL